MSGRIAKWTSTIGAKEFGLKTIEVLIDNGVIDSISSLYSMDLDKIANIERMGKRSAAKMKKELDSHKEMTLAKFVAGYNIDGVGETVIDNIIKAKGFKSFGDFFAYSKLPNRFVCDGVGDIISTKLANGLYALREDME